MHDTSRQLIHTALDASIREYGSYTVGNRLDYCAAAARRYWDTLYAAFRKAFIQSVTDLNKKVFQTCLNVLDAERSDHALVDSGLLEWSTKDFQAAFDERRISRKELEASRLSLNMITVLKEIVAYPAPVFRPVSIPISETQAFKDMRVNLLNHLENQPAE